MRYLSLAEVLRIHERVLRQSGGGAGVRDLGALESAVVQPRTSFGGSELYRTIAEKAAALCFALCCNHPFVDGNKRVAHAAAEVFLLLNGHALHAGVDVQERIMLSLAAGELSREQLVDWFAEHVVESRA